MQDKVFEYKYVLVFRKVNTIAREIHTTDWWWCTAFAVWQQSQGWDYILPHDIRVTGKILRYSSSERDLCKYFYILERYQIRPYNVWAVVAVNWRSDPMLAAAIICTAHPQSTDATLAMLPTVFESFLKFQFKKNQWMNAKIFFCEKKKALQPTIQERKHRQRVDENINVQ